MGDIYRRSEELDEHGQPYGSEFERRTLEALRAARESVYDQRTGRAKGIGTAIPVFAPTLDAIADFNSGNYQGAAFNAVMAAGDVLPWTSAVKLLKLGHKIGWGNLARRDLTHRQTRDLLKKAGYIFKGQEAHHTRAVMGRHRSPDWRNNPFMIKPMVQSNHRRLTGTWGGMPRYHPLARLWHGTNHWQKSLPVGAATYGIDGLENRVRSSASAHESANRDAASRRFP